MRQNAKFFSAVLLIFCSTSFLICQTPESDETMPLSIPPANIGQVIKRVLTWYFKPSDKKRSIKLAGNIDDAPQTPIQANWLPRIKGVEFQLLSETERKNQRYFLFTKLERERQSQYVIGFVYEHWCDGYTGDIWRFRTVKNKFKLWKVENEGIGSGGCDYGPDEK